MRSIFSLKMSRRNFLQGIGNILGASVLAKMFPGVAEAAEKKFVHIRQIVTADSGRSRMIMWDSEGSRADSRVEVRCANGENVSTFPAVEYAYTFPKPGGGKETPIFIHEAFLTELVPMQKYEYRLLTDGVASPWMPLGMPAENYVSGLIFCDSQCGLNYDAWRDIAELGIRDHGDADFVSCIGDLVDNGQSLWHWQEWLRGAESFLPGKIFVPVMGNHECYSLDWKMCLPEGYFAWFGRPANGSLKFPGYYYAFRMGAAKFFVLNTQMEELEGLRPGLLAEEIAWLRREAAEPAAWRIVLMHKDILTYERDGEISPEGLAFMPLFDELGIDLVLTGHMHAYRVRGHIENFRPAPKGPYYIMAGLAGNCYYSVPKDKIYDIEAGNDKRQNYIFMEITPKEILLSSPDYKRIRLTK